MKLLLDTHAFLWFVLDDPKLSSPARDAIASESNEILVSPASYWEIAIKISLGKYRLSTTFEQFWDTGIGHNDMTVLPIEVRHTARLIDMPFHHRDPFDRLVIAQALAEHLHLISADPRFDLYGVARIW